MVDWKIAPSPQKLHILTPGSCEYDFIWYRDFADVIQLRILRWGNSPGLSSWIHCNHNSPIRKMQEESESEMSTYGSRNWRDALWKWRKGPQAKEQRQPWEAGNKALKWILPSVSRKNQPYWSSDLSPVKPISGFWSLEIREYPLVSF